MSRLKAMLGVFCVAALCMAVMGVGNASATTMLQSGGTAAEGTIKDVTNGASTLSATVAGVEFEISCAKQSGSGTSANTESGGNMFVVGSATTVNYEECATVKPAGGVCTVPATITTNLLKSKTEAGTTKQKYEPESGTTFVTFTVAGTSCPAALKGSKSVTGTATSEVTNEAGGVQSFTATSGSALKYAGQAASFISSNKFATEGGAQVFPKQP